MSQIKSQEISHTKKQMNASINCQITITNCSKIIITYYSIDIKVNDIFNKYDIITDCIGRTDKVEYLPFPRQMIGIIILMFKKKVEITVLSLS